MTGSSGGRVTLDNRSFPIFPGPLFQNEARCSAFDMEIIFHSHANKTHFHNKGCAPSLILKVRVFGTRKWPIYLHIHGVSDLKNGRWSWGEEQVRSSCFSYFTPT